MKIRAMIPAVLLVCLSLPMAMAARPAPAQPLARSASSRRQGAGKIHQATGEVITASPASLLLLHARGRGKQKMAFTLTAQTKKTVPLSQGRRIIVFYREIDGRRVAERIRSAPPARHRRR